MNSKQRKWRGAVGPLALCGLGLSLTGGVAVAGPQQPPKSQAQSQTQLQEVVVTAQKRRQNIQNVPIAISAFTAKQIQQQGVTSLAALSAQTPGVTLNSGSPFSGDSSVLSASIRGIGQSDFAININPAVGVYLDGVYLGMSVGANLNLLDVQRVEIDKGPQGTLFGANTIGGAISIITHTPGEKPRFIGQITGGSFDRRDVGFTADVPIIKHKLLASITFGSQHQNGWQKVIPYPANSPYAQAPFVVDPQTAYPEPGYGTASDYGGTGVTSVRSKVLWFATNRLKFTFTGDWTHENQTALPNVVVGTFHGNLLSANFSTLYNLCISNSAASLPGAVAAASFGVFAVGSQDNELFSGICSQPRAHVPGLSIGGAPLLGAGYVGGPPGPFNYNNHPGTAYQGTNDPRIYLDNAASMTGNINTTYGVGPDYARSDIFGFSVTTDYQINDDLRLKSISGYRQLRWRIGTELDGTPETMFQVSDHQHQWQVSEEIQLLGKALDGKLNYVTGLYYFKEAGYVHDYVPFEGILEVYDVANDAENVNYAGYFHADYNPTAHWGFTVGGRYTDAQAYFLGGQSDLNSFPFGSYCWQNPCGPLPPFTDIIPNAGAPGTPYFRYFPGIPDGQQWHIFDPTAGIQFHFNRNIMTYVSWSKGFMAGGWTTRLSLAPISSPKAARYGPETSKSWELGLKSTLFHHHLILNTDVFDTDFNNIQVNIQNGPSPTLTNAGNAKIRGWELQAESLVGDTGLELNGSAAFLDAYYTSVTSPYVNFPQYALPDGSTVCPVGPVIGPSGQPVCSLKGYGSSPLKAKLPKTPRWKFTFDPVYTYVMRSGAELRFIPVFSYITSMYNDLDNTPQMWRPVTRVFNASLHYVSPSGEYNIAVGGTNLTNDRYITSGQPNYAAGFIDAYYNPPREWYATLRVKLGG